MKAHRLLLFSLAAAVLVAAASWALSAPIAEAVPAVMAALMLTPFLAEIEHHLRMATWSPAEAAELTDDRFAAPQTGRPQLTAFA